MKFLIDAQLPKSLSNLIQSQGFESIHTLDLPNKNNTTDREIIRLSVSESLIVVSKDSDFLENYLIKKEPYKLILVSTGNISNSLLIDIFKKNMSKIISLLENNSILEITNSELLVHTL